MAEDIVQEAKELFATIEGEERENRERFIKSAGFIDGEGQWGEAEKLKRLSGPNPKPCLTFNRLPQFANQITNEQRQQKHSIKAIPQDDSDVKTAEVIQGLFRNIEAQSDAGRVYADSFQPVVECGWSYFRVLPEYADPEVGFNQELRIKRIANPLSVLWDHHSVEPDGSDANVCFITDHMDIRTFRELYGESKTIEKIGNSSTFEAMGDPAWFTDKSCRITEFWKRTYQRGKFYRLESRDGEVEELAGDDPKLPQSKGKPDIEYLDSIGWKIVKERDTKKPLVKCYKMNGEEVLQEWTWMGRYIPIIPIYGMLRIINGKRRVNGIVWNAMDAQRMYNYWMTAATEMIALAPKAPMLGARGQFKDPKWATANTDNWAYLEWESIDANGVQQGAPVRTPFEPRIQGFLDMALHAAENLKATTGLYDASLGQRTNEVSGRAIRERKEEGNTANYHLQDNLYRSIRHCARICVDAMRYYYDVPQTLRILAEDDTPKQVLVNQAQDVEKAFDLRTGRYDVVIETGPSFATKRKEGADALLELAKVDPQLMMTSRDLVYKSLDVPYAQDLAERARKALPPGLADAENGADIPPQAAMALQQMQQQMQELQAALAEATDVINSKKVEAASREKIALIQAEVDKLKIQMDFEIAQLKARTDMATTNEELESKEEIAMMQARSAERQAESAAERPEPMDSD